MTQAESYELLKNHYRANQTSTVDDLVKLFPDSQSLLEGIFLQSYLSGLDCVKNKFVILDEQRKEIFECEDLESIPKNLNLTNTDLGLKYVRTKDVSDWPQTIEELEQEINLKYPKGFFTKDAKG